MKKASRKLYCFLALGIISILLGGCNPMETYTTINLLETDNTLFFQNDLGITQIGDPFILKTSDDSYYLYCTSAPNGFYCWKSKDLVNWSGKKMCFIKESDAWCADSFWAPEVVEYNNQYYMYYTARNIEGSLRIGLAISDKPEGPFKDVHNKPLFDFGYAAIDANVLIDKDGSKYLYFSRDCSENETGGIRKSEIYGVSLSDDMLSIEGEPVLLITPEQKWEKVSVNPLWNEGPEILLQDGIYYLTYSANYFADQSYSVGYATSSSPLGPYKKAENNPILTSGLSKTISGPGHHSFTRSPDDTELWMAYHSHTNPAEGGGNRKLNIDKVLFTEDGTLFVNGPTICTLPIPSDGSYTNVAKIAQIDSEAANASLLTDGIITVNRKDSEYDTDLPVAQEKTELTLTFKKPVDISDILIFRGANDSRDFKTIAAVFDDEFKTEEYTIPENRDQRAASLHFVTRTVSSVTLLLTPRDNNTEISLSEIMLISREK